MGVKRGGEAGHDVVENQPFQALGDDGCECNWAVVLVADGGRFFWHWDDGGRLQASWDGGLCEGEVEDFGEDLRELCGAGLEHLPQKLQKLSWGSPFSASFPPHVPAQSVVGSWKLDVAGGMWLQTFVRGSQSVQRRNLTPLLVRCSRPLLSLYDP